MRVSVEVFEEDTDQKPTTKQKSYVWVVGLSALIGLVMGALVFIASPHQSFIGGLITGLVFFLSFLAVNTYAYYIKKKNAEERDE